MSTRWWTVQTVEAEAVTGVEVELQVAGGKTSEFHRTCWYARSPWMTVCLREMGMRSRLCMNRVDLHNRKAKEDNELDIQNSKRIVN